jgi:hypothetical protein
MLLRSDESNVVELEDSGKQEGMLGVEAVKLRLEESLIQYALINVQRDSQGQARVALLSWQGVLVPPVRRDAALTIRSLLASFAESSITISAVVNFNSTTDITYQSVLKELPKREAKSNDGSTSDGYDGRSDVEAALKQLYSGGRVAAGAHCVLTVEVKGLNRVVRPAQLTAAAALSDEWRRAVLTPSALHLLLFAISVRLFIERTLFVPLLGH